MAYADVKGEAGLGAAIPPELFPLIIRHVEFSWELRNCCLVSRAWRKFAQPLIFSSLSLSQEKECIAWNKKFDQNPHLTSAVTHVFFWGGECMEDIDEEDVYADIMDRALRSDAALTLTARLPRVSSVEIAEFTQWGPRETNALLQCREVRSLAIASMEIPPVQLLTLVHSFPKLQSLSLSRFDLDRDPEPHLEAFRNSGQLLTTSEREFQETPPQCLGSLALDGIQHCADLIMWLLSPRFDLSCLKSASLSWNSLFQEPAQSHALDNLMTSIGPYVMYLVLGIDSSTSRDPDMSKPDLCLAHLKQPSTLSSFTCLHTLSLKDDTRKQIGQYASVAGLSICELLPTLNASSLHHITLDLKLEPSPETGLSLHASMAEWEFIDTTLSGPSFLALRRVVIAFTLEHGCYLFYENPPCPEPPREDAIVMMRACLPRLTASDRLRFDLIHKTR